MAWNEISNRKKNLKILINNEEIKHTSRIANGWRRNRRKNFKNFKWKWNRNISKLIRCSKSSLIWTFIIINAYIKNIAQIYKLYLKELETKTKVSRRKEITKIKEIQNVDCGRIKRIKQKKELGVFFFLKINKLDNSKSFARLRKKRRLKYQKLKEDITTNTTEMLRTIKKHSP